MAAYAISRMIWKLRNLVYGLFMIGIMIPAQAALLPLFQILDRLGLKGGYLGLLIPYIAGALPMSIMILVGFYRGIPREMEEVKKSGNPQILVGDGAELCYNAFRAAGIPARLAPPHLLRQAAWGVARAALELARQGKLVPAGQMTPQYHRLSQAERERLERMKNQTNE